MQDVNQIAELQSRLEEKSNPKIKSWWERYLRHVIPFRGVKMADIRATLHGWIDEESIGSQLSREEKKALALDLMRQEHAEDKLAGILYLKEVLLTAQGIRRRLCQSGEK